MAIDLAASMVAAANAGMFVALFVRMVMLIRFYRMGFYTKLQEGVALLQIVIISALLVAELYTILHLV